MCVDASFVGAVDKSAAAVREEQRQIFYEANQKVLPKKEKNRMRGKNKIASKLRRKQKNVIDEQTEKLKAKLIKEKEEKAMLKTPTQPAVDAAASSGALRRFF